MQDTMVLFDKRLLRKGQSITADAPLTWDPLTRTYFVDRSTALDCALDRVRGYANGKGKLGDLMIMCHGYVGFPAVYRPGIPVEKGDPSRHGDAGNVLGFGWQLCKEGLNLTTVKQASLLKGMVQRISVYACGAAHTQPGQKNTPGDGKRLCRELAAHTQAIVLASDEYQVFHWSAFFCGKKQLVYKWEYRDWEGKVYEFHPDGSVCVHGETEMQGLPKLPD